MAASALSQRDCSAHHRHDALALLRQRHVCRKDHSGKQVRICRTSIISEHATDRYLLSRFVPQANRSLRSFNMYLNTRTAPRRSFFSFLRSTPPRRTVLVQQAIEKDGDGTVPMQRVPSTGKSPSTVAAARRLHIPTIPPSSNPRGELIFSGKVSPQFREGYERYRAAFERRRSEKMDERRRSGWRRWWVFGDRGDGRRGAAASPAGLDANAAERGVGMSTRSSPAPSLRSSVRSSPRKGRPRLNAMAQSGSETSSPAGSRGSSPNATPTIHNEPTMVAGPPSSTDSFKRGRRSSMRDQGIGADPGDGEGSAQGERRGRDRTPSITAVSDERLRRHSVNVMDKQPVGAEVTSDVIAEEASTDAADAAAAAAQLGSLSTPDPALVADQADNRAEVEATLREPAT